MDSPVVKKIFLALAILLTLIVVGYAVSTSNKTKPLEQTSENSLATVNQAITTNEFSKYENQEVSGSEVISCINTKASTNLTIYVKTKKDTTTVAYNSASYNVTDINAADYIEPTENFLGTLGKTTNGTTNSITFIQQ